MNNKKWLRIIVPVLILGIIGGVWLVKNNQRALAQAKQEELVKDNPEFILEESSVNLEGYLKHKMPVILDFGAEECPPCQQMRPALEAAHQKTIGKAVIKFFDVWKHAGLGSDYPVRVIPTQLIFNPDGTPYEPSEATAKALKFAMYNSRETEKHVLTVHEGMLTEEHFAMILADMGVSYE